MDSERNLDGLVERLRLAEQAVARARDDYLRLRNAVDSAGELALWERLESAERALREVIQELDEMVYPVDQTSGG